MKIAQIAPLVERVPPKKYGGTERVVSSLTEELVKRGHDVTLFASGDSITSARLYPVYPLSLREARVPNMYGANMANLMGVGIPYQRQDSFDIIHDHTFPFSIPTANLARTPVVATMHGQLDSNKLQLYERFTNPYLVSISKSQVPDIAYINHIATIYNGLEMSQYPFSNTHDGYLLFVGRIDASKGLHHAIAVAKKLNIKLIIAAKLERDIPAYYQYFKAEIEPHLSSQIEWIGEVTEEKRNQLMSNAMAFLHPACWNEPFGLTMIEAMACGAPVVAYERGSIPEVVIDGKTGYVVSTVEEMINAVARIDKIDRRRCRKIVLERFNASKMTDEYEMIYQAVLQGKYGEYKKTLEEMNGIFTQTSLHKNDSNGSPFKL